MKTPNSKRHYLIFTRLAGGPSSAIFRRILCNMLGSDVEAGLLPSNLNLLGNMVEDICFNSAKNYFPMQLD